MKTLKGLDFTKSLTDIFHKMFGHKVSSTPTLPSAEEVQNRVNYIAEELVEALGAMANNQGELMGMVTNLIYAIDAAEDKQVNSGFVTGDENKLIALVDAFTDVNYFTSGTFSILGVEPQPMFDIVQDANMAKLGEDGKPIYRESDGKIMKPEGWEAPEPKLAAELKRQMEATK